MTNETHSALQHLIASDVGLRHELRVGREAQRTVVYAGEDLHGALLELAPPAGLSDIPSYLLLRDGGADVGDIPYAPSALKIVRWDSAALESGLIIATPQLLARTDRAGADHDTPIAGGRRTDGRLEMWIEASVHQEVTATIGADSALGTVADVEFVNGEHQHRLLIALAQHGTNRTVGFARLPIDPTKPLTQTRVVVRQDLAATPNVSLALIRESRSGATSGASRQFFDAALADAAGG